MVLLGIDSHEDHRLSSNMPDLPVNDDYLLSSSYVQTCDMSALLGHTFAHARLQGCTTEVQLLLFFSAKTLLVGPPACNCSSVDFHIFFCWCHTQQTITQLSRQPKVSVNVFLTGTRTHSNLLLEHC